MLLVLFRLYGLFFFDGRIRHLGSLHSFQLWRCGGMNRGIYREKPPTTFIY
jgi:hypothetical protein